MDHGAHALTLDYSDNLVAEPLKHLYLWLMQTVDPDKDFVVCESFEFRKEDAKNREYIDYSTGEFVGVVKLYCQMTGTAYEMQSASEGKGFWDDDKLKRVGLWSSLGDRHQRDAARHWLHYDCYALCNSYYLNLLK